jgi:hypothetical protein
MSPIDPANGTPAPSDPTSRLALLKETIPPWVATVLALVTATATITLYVAGLAEKNELEALEERVATTEGLLASLAEKVELEALEERLVATAEEHDSTHASRAAASDYAECVSKHFREMKEFSTELAIWVENESSNQLDLFEVYEKARDLLRNYRTVLRLDRLEDIKFSGVHLNTPELSDLILRQHAAGLRKLKDLHENFAIDAQECVDRLRNTDQ